MVLSAAPHLSIIPKGSQVFTGQMASLVPIAQPTVLEHWKQNEITYRCENTPLTLTHTHTFYKLKYNLATAAKQC